MASADTNVPEEDSLTMMDVLEQQEALEEDADAVLGAGKDDRCTYDEGYLSRQALYACLTCCPAEGAGGRAGVCLGCSLHCHASHTLVELYTKRNFRCDCGNSKFVMTSCKLTSNKDPTNCNNKYNQNFDGFYCSCHRPYPDPEQPDDEPEDEMIQCCCCEDWYHSKHLGSDGAPPGDQYSEVVCPSCVARLPFIKDYSALAVTVVSKSACDTKVDTEDSNVPSSEAKEKVAPPAEGNVSNGDTPTSATNGVAPSSGTDNAKLSEEKPATNGTLEAVVEQKLPIKNSCSAGLYRGLPEGSSALFLPEDWRTKLCTCDNCTETYSRLDVCFLARPEDSISHYEQLSKQRSWTDGGDEGARRTARQSSVERELDALNSVDRVTRTEMVAEYNTLSTELRDYLRKFADSGKVVRDEDIREFFAGLEARKKQRGNDGMPPDSCKW